MNRPMVWVGGAFAAGVFAAAQGGCPGLLCPLVLLLLGVGASFVRLRRFPERSVSVLLCFFSLGALLWNVRHSGPPGDPLSRYAAEHPNEVLSLEGRIRSIDIIRPETQYASFVLDVDRVALGPQPLALPGKTLVRWTRPGEGLLADCRVRLDGVVALDIGHVNPDIQGPEDYYRRHGVQSVVRIKERHSVQLLAPGRATSVRYWASRLRLAQARQLARCVPKSILPFVMAVWLGDRSDLAQAEYQRYVESGTAHILSVSGLHMAVVYTSAAFLLRMVCRSRKTRTLLALVLVFFFALMSGARIATVRSAVMIGVYLAADFFERERDAKTALSLSAFALLLENPDSLFDPGFQLSFLSVASILLFAERIRDALLPLPFFLRAGFGTSLAAQILTLPVAVRQFHILPLFSPLTNLIVVPLLTVVLWLTCGTVVCAPFAPGLGLLFGHALAPCVGAIRLVAQAVTGHLLVTSPTALALLLYWAGLFWFAGGRPGLERGSLRAVFGAVWCALIVLTWHPPREAAEVVFLDVGHGDATFVRTPGGSTVLIDGGDRSGMVDQGARIVGPFLWSNHVTRLDYVVATHPDRDHVGGLFYILDHFRVGAVLLGCTASGEYLEGDLLRQCEARSIPVRWVQRGEAIALKEARLEVLHPRPGWFAPTSINDNSVVLRLLWPGLTVLLAGDIEGPAEALLIESGGCRADVLKVPHHGSGTSSTPEFIQAVAPRYAIVPAGRAGHEVTDDYILLRYQVQGAAVCRTDHRGGLTVRVERNTLKVLGERDRRGYIASLPVSKRVVELE